MNYSGEKRFPKLGSILDGFRANVYFSKRVWSHWSLAAKSELASTSRKKVKVKVATLMSSPLALIEKER
jgi:hypothetical protein